MHRPRLPALLLFASLLLPASSPAEAPKAKYEFETFQLILLVRAPTWKKLPDAEAEALQAAHIAHLTKMGEAGKAVVCGPFGDQRDVSLRGACIYRVASLEEARALAEQDPTVKAGQLRIEAVTWFVGKGVMTFPQAKAPAPQPK
jgi:uncharacterized protein YciI